MSLSPCISPGLLGVLVHGLVPVLTSAREEKVEALSADVTTGKKPACSQSRAWWSVYWY